MRRIALLTLKKLGVEAKEAVTALAEALKGSNYQMRREAALIVGTMGTEANAAVPTLLGALRDSDFRGARFKGEIAGFEPLHQFDGEQSWDLRSCAANALCKISNAAVPALVSALGDADDEMRSLAVGVLGHMGQTAVPALLDCAGKQE